MQGRYSARLSGEIYTHRLLWHTAEHHHKLGRTLEDGSYHHCLSAVLMAAFAFEAFLNYVGPRLAPEHWSNERTVFTRGRYRGTLGKLRFLGEKLALTLRKDARPYSTVRQLFKDRNLIAHARPEVVSLVVHAESHAALPTHKEPDIFRLGEVDYCSRVIGDVEALGDQLVTSAIPRVPEGTFMGPSAFRGALWAQGGSLSLNPEPLA